MCNFFPQLIPPAHRLFFVQQQREAGAFRVCRGAVEHYLHRAEKVENRIQPQKDRCNAVRRKNAVLVKEQPAVPV